MYGSGDVPTAKTQNHAGMSDETMEPMVTTSTLHGSQTLSHTSAAITTVSPSTSKSLRHIRTSTPSSDSGPNGGSRQPSVLPPSRPESDVELSGSPPLRVSFLSPNAAEAQILLPSPPTTFPNARPYRSRRPRAPKPITDPPAIRDHSKHARSSTTRRPAHSTGRVAETLPHPSDRPGFAGGKKHMPRHSPRIPITPSSCLSSGAEVGVPFIESGNQWTTRWLPSGFEPISPSKFEAYSSTFATYPSIIDTSPSMFETDPSMSETGPSIDPFEIGDSISYDPIAHF
ncbi:uncharacterized protein B0H18DRAFT_592464 [Fomitopsis serialis]|uniref:uncharacterized protein n=1 Tax=Fomitopsis serialis TaxID=139415 RepID=UPI002007D9AF|nr:uncharacterized protein B0H18DRAFT_592464 [Neoantrodia serialis]KAH9920442.1 hypothetical protein B0H18DRAFT_592464 [Neoantrodia serialis]